MKDSQGIWREKREDIEGIISGYFNHFFQTTNPDEQEIDMVLDQIEPRVPIEANQMLSLPFTADEFGSVIPSRGLRQGDPVFPYLFICCAEVLISMINKAVEEGELRGIKIAPTAPTISNLCFADDTLLFSLGHCPSATWQSLIKARPYLLKGLRRRIGNGKDTSPWADPWLVDEGSFKMFTRRPIESAWPDRVADIIDKSIGAWDVPIIEEIFWPIDRGRILSIPVGSREASDRWVWHYSGSGKFTVRSCYHNIISGQTLTSGSNPECKGSSSGEVDRNWNVLWHLPIPPKIRVFLWRACLEILPTQAELTRRRISQSAVCNICGYESETSLHVFMVCNGMERVWKNSPFELNGSKHFGSTWEWIKYLQMVLPKNTFLLALVVTWAAWHQRNKIVHGDNGLTGEDLVSWCRNFIVDFQRETQLTIIPRRPSHIAVWNPPPEEEVKVNFDASFPMGKLRLLLSLHGWSKLEGECIWWSVTEYPGRPRSVDGEAHAALHALTKAQGKRWSKIKLEGDCLQSIMALKGGELTESSFGAYIEDYCSIAKTFVSCQFSFVKRSGNILAHHLASMSVSSCTEGDVLPAFLALFN
ncbi:PREDICTED: uncharacterized protein LOC105958069 [Erythranthe guttata]|uniref:uncharacterized protein LOC105958069 n=1 Tax=Erythranthe guttata TaxID=4155 RepID=UPI00064D7D19|nr:PREDICTED: uncharacterized protein LOC105958069 [Erythranthe guttata]|eukprot:XP_012837526.1 PREDICTED: uncharacterized protein LOC105958069 [Erythranthe guttata]